MTTMPIELEIVKQKLDTATCPEDIFGKEANAAKTNYRLFAREAHPDRWKIPSDKNFATEVFQSLQNLWKEAEAKIKNGTYGNNKPHVVTATEITLQKGQHIYKIKNLVTKDSFSNFYECLVDDKEGFVFRLARDSRDNDLIKREASALKAIYGANDGDKHLPYYIPTLCDNFLYRDSNDKKRRMGNVLSRVPEGFYSLADVKNKYPQGIDPRDMAWMFRRILVAFGMAAQGKIVHGAMVHPNILIHPEEHGVMLVNWHASCQPTERVPIMEPQYESFYPDAVKKKEEVFSAIDVYMACGVMIDITNPDLMPRLLTRFFKGCRLSLISQIHPWDLLKEFDEVLERAYGPRKFRPFSMK